MREENIMRVIVAGATGAVGMPVVTRLLAAGHHATGIVRNAHGVSALRAVGADAVIADVLDREAVLRATNDISADAVVSELTALKKPPARHGDMHETDRLRIDGTANLLEVAQQTNATRFVTQSMIFGYGYRDLGVTPLTEESPFGTPQGDRFDEHLEAMASNERQVLGADGIDGIALRYGLLYGNDAESVAAMLKRRAISSARVGGELAFIHHLDAADATVAAIERGRGGAYNVVDDVPATFRELLDSVAAAYHVPRPYVLPNWMLRAFAPYAAKMMTGVNMRASNEKAARELGWRPRYRSINDGVLAGVHAKPGGTASVQH
jgi:nucleoside-diphosphate-sugar epimerase